MLCFSFFPSWYLKKEEKKKTDLVTSILWTQKHSNTLLFKYNIFKPLITEITWWIDFFTQWPISQQEILQWIKGRYCCGKPKTDVSSFNLNFLGISSILFILFFHNLTQSFPGGASGKELACQCRLDIRDSGSIPGSGRSPGRGHGNPSSILAWRIPWTEEPGRLKSFGSQSQTWLKHLAQRSAWQRKNSRQFWCFSQRAYLLFDSENGMLKGIR